MQNLFDKASLVMVPSGYDNGKLYNIKPEDKGSAFEFERATMATRVNSSGLVETMFPEATNLLLHSNQFDTTWLNQLSGTGTITGGQSGHDGSNDAWLISKDTSTFRSVRQVISWSGVSTFSVYAKAGSLSNAALRMDTGSVAIQILFDLTDGSVTSTSGTYINAGSDDIGGGWYRLYVSANVSSGTNVHIYVDRDGTTSGNIYIQDAQLENGYFATPYIETTTQTVTRQNQANQPRIDYTSGEGALLLEPQRTNDVTYSEDFSQSYWFNSGVNVTPNEAIAPDGTTTADLTELSSNNNRLGKDISSSAGTYTFSFYVKAKEGESGVWVSRLIGDSTINTETTVNDTEWVRVTETVTLSSNGTIFIYPSYRIDGTSTLFNAYIWGAQLELGSYATSYIPTNGVIESRNLDLSTNSNISDFLPSTGYTIFFEAKSPPAFTGSTQAPLNFTSSTTDRISPYFYNGTLVTDIVANGVVRGALVLESSVTVNTVYKIAISVQNNNIRKSSNGSSTSLLNSDLITPVLSALRLGSYNSTNNALGSTLGQIVLFPEALTDEELQRLTSPSADATTFTELANNNGYTIL